MIDQATIPAGLSLRHWIGTGAVALLWFYCLSDEGQHVKGWAILPLIGITLCTAAGLFEKSDDRRGEAARWFTWAWVLFLVTLVFAGWLPDGTTVDTGTDDWW